MPKLIQLTKALRYNSHNKNNAARQTLQKPERRVGGEPPSPSGADPKISLPPLPPDRGYDVCGFGRPKEFLITHFAHHDHCPAVTDAKLIYGKPIAKQIDERVPFYRREEFNVELVEFKGEVIEGVHVVYDPERRRHVEVTVCNYVFADIKAMLIAEDSRANELLAMARERGLTPLYMWQPREHVNLGYTLHAKDIYDGYFLDPKTEEQSAPNVIPKCVPSILDILKDPKAYKGNPYAERVLKYGSLQ